MFTARRLTPTSNDEACVVRLSVLMASMASPRRNRMVMMLHDTGFPLPSEQLTSSRPKFCQPVRPAP